MVTENKYLPSLNRLLFRTFLGTLVMTGLIATWEYFADPDPVDAGTFLFYSLVLVMSLGVQWAIFKIKLYSILNSYPALASNLIGITVFYIFLFLKQPVILFGVILLILVALAWHWITTYRAE
jgi:hypothetical protein